MAADTSGRRGTSGLSPRERGNPYPEISRPRYAGVYPRASGGTMVLEHVTVQGLSPRERGNPSWPIVASASNAEGTVYPRASGGTP